VEKRQLTLLHQQRVQADMDDRKRRLLQKYVEAVDVDQQDIEVSSNHIRQVSRPAKIFWPDLVLSVTDLSCRKIETSSPNIKTLFSLIPHTV